MTTGLSKLLKTLFSSQDSINIDLSLKTEPISNNLTRMFCFLLLKHTGKNFGSKSCALNSSFEFIAFFLPYNAFQLGDLSRNVLYSDPCAINLIYNSRTKIKLQKYLKDDRRHVNSISDVKSKCANIHLNVFKCLIHKQKRLKPCLILSV